MNVHELVRNWQKGARIDGDSPLPSNLRKNPDEQVFVDWDRYVQADELLLDLPPMVRACFLAEYAPAEYNRHNHRKVAAQLSKQDRQRYVRLVFWWLDKKCCR